jgi:hypothetical protein
VKVKVAKKKGIDKEVTEHREKVLKPKGKVVKTVTKDDGQITLDL